MYPTVLISTILSKKGSPHEDAKKFMKVLPSFSLLNSLVNSIVDER